MAEIKISGSSDDLIEIEGAITEEFYLPSSLQDEDGVFLAFSEGTVVQIKYGDKGIWRIGLVSRGEASYHNDENADHDDDRYSDVVTLTGDDFAWVVLGTAIAR